MHLGQRLEPLLAMQNDGNIVILLLLPASLLAFIPLQMYVASIMACHAASIEGVMLGTGFAIKDVCLMRVVTQPATIAKL